MDKLSTVTLPELFASLKLISDEIVASRNFDNANASTLFCLLRQISDGIDNRYLLLATGNDEVMNALQENRIVLRQICETIKLSNEETVGTLLRILDVLFSEKSRDPNGQAATYPPVPLDKDVYVTKKSLGISSVGISSAERVKVIEAARAIENRVKEIAHKAPYKTVGVRLDEWEAIKSQFDFYIS